MTDDEAIEALAEVFITAEQSYLISRRTEQRLSPGGEQEWHSGRADALHVVMADIRTKRCWPRVERAVKRLKAREPKARP